MSESNELRLFGVNVDRGASGVDRFVVLAADEAHARSLAQSACAYSVIRSIEVEDAADMLWSQYRGVAQLISVG